MHRNPSSIQHTVAVHQVAQALSGIGDASLRQMALERAGIAPALLDAPLARVTQAQYARLLSVLSRRLDDELWGLCSRPVPLGTLGSACRLMVQQRLLGDAVRTGLRFYRALLADFVPRLQRRGDVAELRLVPRAAGLNTSQAYAVRVVMFLGYGVMCWLAARRIPVLEVVYDDGAIDRRTDASRLFQAPIHWAQGEWGLRFDATWLDLPVVQSADSVEEFLRQLPGCLLLKYRDQTSSTERIRRLLKRYLAEQMPSLEAVSAMLATTPQTLRRRLQREGQGYQQIKDTLRRDVALQLLMQSELPLQEIAARVGFAEASTFHRAFKAWTGLAPGAYRSAHHAA